MNHIFSEGLIAQLPYALTVAGVTFITYIIAGFVKSAVLSLFVGLIMIIGAIAIIKYILKEKEES